MHRHLNSNMMKRSAVSLCILSLLIGAQQAAAAISKATSNNKLVDLIIKKKYNDAVKQLGVEGLDVNQPDTKGRLPMAEAVKTRDIRFVDALLQHGGSVNTTDPATGAHIATFAFRHSLNSVAQLLLAYGADINVKDKAGSAPRDYAPTKELHDMIKVWDVQGAAGFEDPPGTWTRAHVPHEPGQEERVFWSNTATGASQWNTPPSCGWQRVTAQGHALMYTNTVTGQMVTTLPKALSWRLVRQSGQEFWYNWAANISQLNPPHELPHDLLQEAIAHKNVRWHNLQTGELSWDDPRHFTTQWREMKDEGGQVFYYHIGTGSSQWEPPADLAWQEVVADPSSTSTSPQQEGSASRWWHNTVTGESTWTAPGHHAWVRHDSDL